MTLARAVALIGLLPLAGAGLAAYFAAPWPLILWLAGIGILMTGGVLIERVAYKSVARQPPGPGWVKTPERFVDPSSGRLVDVYLKPATGKRLYVDAGAPPNHESV